MANSFKDLQVWEKSIQLVELTYKISQALPKSETYSICSQIQRSSVSVPSNIAEGYKRSNRKEYIQFLSVANASAAELETQIIIIQRIYPLIDTEKAENTVLEVQKMLTTMIRKLKN